ARAEIGARSLITRRGIDAEAPGRAVAGQGFALEGGDLGFRHTLEIVVIVVEFTDVIGTEPAIFIFLAATFGRAVEARRAAAIPFATARRSLLAGMRRRFEPALLAGRDPYGVEIFRVQVHDLNYGLAGRAKQESMAPPDDRLTR